MMVEDEDELWQRFTRDIKPLKKPPAAKKQPARAPAKKTPVPARPVERIVIKPGLKTAAAPKPAQPPQLDRRTDEKLRKGKMPVEATLDLHGMTQAQAGETLEKFLLRAYKSGLRCV